jgi:hypothetical protein
MNWFRKTRFVHIPASLPAYLIYIVAVGFLLSVFMAVDRNSHSASDTLYGVFPFVASVFLLIEWVAEKTTR